MNPPPTDESFAADEASRRWLTLLGHVFDGRAMDLDPCAAGYDNMTAETPGSMVFPECDGVVLSGEDENEVERPVIGVMIDAMDGELPAIASSLAGLALERGCEIVVLTEAPLCGLEGYGFRVERISGETEAQRETCIEHIRRFWQMEFTI